MTCRFDSGPRYHKFFIYKVNNNNSVQEWLLLRTALDILLGSRPLTHLIFDGGVAQLARAFGSYPKGHGFDSLCRYHFMDP